MSFDAGTPIPPYMPNNISRYSTAGLTTAAIAFAQSIGGRFARIVPIEGRRTGNLGWSTQGQTDVINTPGVTVDGEIRYPELTGTEVLELVSTSADDNPTGNGARAVRVYSLNTDGGAIMTIVPTNGITPVELTGVRIIAQQFMIAHPSGAYGRPSGTIDLRIKSGGAYPANTVIERLNPFENLSRSCRYTIPAGHVGLLFRAYGDQDSNGTSRAGFRVRSTAIVYDQLRTPREYHHVVSAGIAPGARFDIDIGVQVPELTTIKIGVTPTGLGASSTVEAGFFVAEIEV